MAPPPWLVLGFALTAPRRTCPCSCCSSARARAATSAPSSHSTSRSPSSAARRARPRRARRLPHGLRPGTVLTHEPGARQRARRRPRTARGARARGRAPPASARALAVRRRGRRRPAPAPTPAPAAHAHAARGRGGGRRDGVDAARRRGARARRRGGRRGAGGRSPLSPRCAARAWLLWGGSSSSGRAQTVGFRCPRSSRRTRAARRDRGRPGERPASSTAARCTTRSRGYAHDDPSRDRARPLAAATLATGLAALALAPAQRQAEPRAVVPQHAAVRVASGAALWRDVPRGRLATSRRAARPRRGARRALPRDARGPLALQNGGASAVAEHAAPGGACSSARASRARSRSRRPVRACAPLLSRRPRAAPRSRSTTATSARSRAVRGVNVARRFWTREGSRA